ncbi:tetratricopeptide repeat protein [Burkholderiaceae bacterium DAT-1]|nr:tetratricopeptide repeat protein [Burkholderiaceae bacterium DAT-1]
MRNALPVIALSLWISAHAIDIDTLWNFDDVPGSEARLQAALERSSVPEERAALITQIARAEGLQGRPARGHAMLDELQTRLSELQPEISIRYMLERGRLYSSSNRPLSERWLRHTIQLASKHKLDGFVIEATHMLALIQQQGSAIDMNLKALKLAEASSDPAAMKWQPTLYNNLGWQYLDQRNYEKALEYLKKAEDWYTSHPDPRGLNAAHWSVGKLLRLNGKSTEALDIQMSLTKAQSVDKSLLGYVFEEIAENLVVLGRLPEAKQYYGKAWKQLAEDPWLSKSDPNRLARLKALSID